MARVHLREDRTQRFCDNPEARQMLTDLASFPH
jgi:hypothetical protein